MPNLSCPSQDINFLNPNSFQLSIMRLPNVSFFCQTVNFPGISIQPLSTATTLSTIPMPSDKITFEPLVVTFIVDSKMENYLEVVKWMRGLGKPEDYSQYTRENRSYMSELTEEARNYSEAFLIINGSDNNMVKKFTFNDCFPTNLSGMTLSSTNTDVQYVTASLTLEYNFYTEE